MSKCILDCSQCEANCILEDRRNDPITVFILDDEKTTRFIVSHIISKSFPNAVISNFTEPEKMLSKVTSDEPVILLTDLNPPINGERVIKEVRKKNKDALIIVMSASNNTNHVLECFKNGANNFIDKINISTISQMVSSHLAARDSEALKESTRNLQMV
jgi:DNA-binding NarL/FixJ family response regulator